MIIDMFVISPKTQTPLAIKLFSFIQCRTSIHTHPKPSIPLLIVGHATFVAASFSKTSPLFVQRQLQGFHPPVGFLD